MGKEIDSRPSPPEIMAQLRRLLERSRFTNSPSQAALLETIVTNYLNKRIEDEKTIGIKVFPGFIPGRSSDVRVAAKSLRKALSDCYAEEGAHDTVIIEIGKGRNYPVLASYNQKSEAVKLYESALGCMGVINSYPWEVLGALNCCRVAIEADPAFAPAYALLSELMLCFASNRYGEITDYGYGPYKGKKYLRQDIGLAREYAIRAVRLDRTNWRGYVALGAYRSCCGLWKQADRAFQVAMELSPDEAVKDPWYCFYLVAIGRMEEAISIAVTMFHATPRGSCWASLVALFEYGAGRFYSPFLIVANSDHAGFLPAAVEACCLLGANDARQAMERLDSLLVREKIKSQFSPAASMGLWALTCGKAGDSGRAMAMLQHIGLCQQLPDVRSEYLTNAKMSMLLDPEKYPSAFTENFRKTAKPDPQREACPWELALACLGLNMRADAVNELRRAVAEHHPMTMWLHIWHFLKPLYSDIEFVTFVIESGPEYARDACAHAVKDLMGPGS